MVVAYGHPQALSPPSVRRYSHLGTTLSGWLLTTEWAPFDAALVSQGLLRLISCSPKLLFSYYSGAVLSSSF